MAGPKMQGEWGVGESRRQKRGEVGEVLPEDAGLPTNDKNREAQGKAVQRLGSVARLTPVVVQQFVVRETRVSIQVIWDLGSQNKGAKALALCITQKVVNRCGYALVVILGSTSEGCEYACSDV